MFAVVKTGGKQYIVSPDAKLKIEKLDVEEGKDVVFGDVLLIVDGDKVTVGNPTIPGVSVIGKVEKQGRDDKIIVFKYKPKKRYSKKMGHRQPFTEVTIKSIGKKTALKKPAAKKTTTKKT